jgi:hypothetical protein
MKIFSPVSAVLLSIVAITSPLRTHQEDFAKLHNHIAFCPSIETVGGHGRSAGRLEGHTSHTFSALPQKNPERSATSQRNPAFTLASLQHSRRDLEPNRLRVR